MLTKPPAALTLRDRLSHLTFAESCKLLGAGGKKLLLEGANLEPDVLTDLKLSHAEARLVWEPDLVASIRLDAGASLRLRLSCSRCQSPCLHLGGLLSLLLEHKSELGLAEPPPEVETASDEVQLLERALADRAKRAKSERMRIRAELSGVAWTNYQVTNAASGKTYRVALRSDKRGESYCSCPDFKINTLGTCKHIMKVLARVHKLPQAVRAKPYRRTRITVHLRYDEGVSLAVALPAALTTAERRIVAPLMRQPIDVVDLVQRLQRLEAGQHAFFVTPDAEEFIQRRLTRARLTRLVLDIRKAPNAHPLRTTLLKEPLLPYQLDGIAFAAGAGRAILADEMGLGKTIQGIGVAKLFAREVGIQRVLVVCPASLKSQWLGEIRRFCDDSATSVDGPAANRRAAYAADTFFTICNYEQVLKDIAHIEKTRWDLIILDEGQRIKNWEAKTSRMVKSLRSSFALVLTGTPLENRLDELHSVAAFIDPHQLGPAFRFLHRHQRRDENGKLVGFKNLDEVRARLSPILLRRTRESVRLELPERSVEFVRVIPTPEQKELHDAHLQTVARIVRKPFITEMDLLRLRMALLMCRMAANSTFLVDKQHPGRSTKLERLAELIDGISNEPDRKVVLFSEWTTMLDLIEPLLQQRQLGFVRLDGSVPQKKRQALVARFQSDKGTRFFLTTNAGSTGLNLQAANTVINVDLPWNPAVLEQRIARAHRMGQKRPVHVFVMITEQTLEENLLASLSAKRDLALAALDSNSTVTDVDVRSQAADLKQKLELLLGAKSDVPLDEGQVNAAAPNDSDNDDRLGRAREHFVGAAIDLIAELAGKASHGHPLAQREQTRVLRDTLQQTLDVRIVADAHGQKRLSMALPPKETLSALFGSLSTLLRGEPR